MSAVLMLAGGAVGAHYWISRLRGTSSSLRSLMVHGLIFTLLGVAGAVSFLQGYSAFGAATLSAPSPPRGACATAAAGSPDSLRLKEPPNSPFGPDHLMYAWQNLASADAPPCGELSASQLLADWPLGSVGTPLLSAHGLRNGTKHCWQNGGSTSTSFCDTILGVASPADALAVVSDYGKAVVKQLASDPTSTTFRLPGHEYAFTPPSGLGNAVGILDVLNDGGRHAELVWSVGSYVGVIDFAAADPVDIVRRGAEAQNQLLTAATGNSSPAAGGPTVSPVATPPVIVVGSLRVSVTLPGQPAHTTVISGFTCHKQVFGPMESDATSASFDGSGSTVSYREFVSGPGATIWIEVIPVPDKAATHAAAYVSDLPADSDVASAASQGSYSVGGSTVTFDAARFELFYGAGYSHRQDAHGFVVVDGSAPRCQN